MSDALETALLLTEARAEVKRLRADNERLRAELSWLGKLNSEKDPDRIIEAHYERLRAALEAIINRP
jgi:hypothetical protein